MPERVDRAWAIGGATGEGVKVCILDSGVERNHPLVGELAGAVSISLGENGETVIAARLADDPQHAFPGQGQMKPEQLEIARLKRESKEEKRVGIWDWQDPYLANSRELNGLKVIMAMLNNWDLKNINNAVLQKGDERFFVVSDLGASFGTPGRSYPKSKAKDNPDQYRNSQFITGKTEQAVDFSTPGRPSWVYIVSPKEYSDRKQMQSLGRNIPREHVLWIGQLLSRLSSKQIRDAFRAAGYSDAEVEQLAQVIEKRIGQLTHL